MGNGCHHNFSLWRDGVNILADPGITELHLTEEGRHALGGLLSHAAGAMLVNGSTVNSYKRYWDAGQFAPSKINWGLDNKTCTVRLSANGRLEYKLPDAAVNPYLSHALLIAACEDGLKNAIDPGEPTVGSSYEGEQDRALPARCRSPSATRSWRSTQDQVVNGRLRARALRPARRLQRRRVGPVLRRRHRLGARRCTGTTPRERGQRSAAPYPPTRLPGLRGAAAVLAVEPRDTAGRATSPPSAELLADELGRELEWVRVPWNDMVPAARRGDADAVLCGQGITPSRQELMDFTRPYAVFHEGVLVRRGEPIHSAADLAGRRVAAIEHSTNMALAETFEGAVPVPFGARVGRRLRRHAGRTEGRRGRRGGRRRRGVRPAGGQRPATSSSPSSCGPATAGASPSPRTGPTCWPRSTGRWPG